MPTTNLPQSRPQAGNILIARFPGTKQAPPGWTKMEGKEDSYWRISDGTEDIDAIMEAIISNVEKTA